MARPTDCKKEIDLKTRITPEMNEGLLKQAQRQEKTRAEIVRESIQEYLTNHR